MDASAWARGRLAAAFRARPFASSIIPNMAESDFLKSYPQHVARLKAEMSETAALEAAVGGDFVTVGKLEKALLVSLGLRDHHTVVDVGCGSGRLALQLSGMSGLGYLGTDVVIDLLDHARALANRPDWRFLITDGTCIPIWDQSADFICFFSVFTHLTHEDSFRYLREASRVLKPGGLIVFSFLEFYIESHWTMFENSLNDARPGQHLNQFIDRHAIATWAKRLSLGLEFIADGDKPHFQIPEELSWHDGRKITGQGNLGQSVAVLSTLR
jgi:SAM-dependent methyltransferase